MSSLPPPPSEVHFIHTHPTDQTEPNPLGRIEHSYVLHSLNGILCCKSTLTEKLNLLELTSLGTMDSSIPRFFSITIFLLCISLQEGLVFFFPLLLEHCIYCSATPGVSLFFPQMVKRLFREKMSSI